MAEKKEIKKDTKVAKVVKAAKKVDFSKLTLAEAKKELETLIIKVRTSEEKDTSKVRILKKHIARELTALNKAK